MAKIRRIDFSPDEWLAGTRELTPAERGVYWDVCALMYSRGGPIADDDRWISGVLGCHWRTWRSIKARLVALRKLEIGPDGITNGRAERELEKAHKRRKDAAEAAQESVRMRSERAHEGFRNASERAQNNPISNEYNEIPEAPAPFHDGANQQPSTINHQSKKESPPLAAASLSSARADFGEAPQAAAASEGPRAAMASRELVDEAFRRWTVLAYDLGIRDVGFLNSDRRAALTQRLTEIGGLEGWNVYLTKIREAKFLRGPNGRPKFWVGLGKLLEPETFSKILEDRYAEHREVDGDRKLSGVDAIAAFAKAGSR